MTRPSVPDLGNALLRSMSQDVPPPHAKKRALVVLGLAHSTVAVVSAAAAAQAGIGPVTAAVDTATAAAVTGTAAVTDAAAVTGAALGTAKVAGFAYAGVLLKPLLIGALAGAVTVGGRELSRLEERTAREHDPTPIGHVQTSPTDAEEAVTRDRRSRGQGQAIPEAAPDVANSQPSARAFVAPNSLSQTPRRQEIPSRSINEPAPTQARPPSFSPGLAQRSSLQASPPDLSLETRELAAVRDLLAAGLTSQARETLDRYDAAFPQGLLRPEAAVLRIELLAATGDLPGARRLARAFEIAYPRSSHLNKIRVLVDSDTRTPMPQSLDPNVGNPSDTRSPSP